MSKISMEDSDSWSCLSSVTHESPVTTHVFVVENFEDDLKDRNKALKLESNVFEVESTKWKVNVNLYAQGHAYEDYVGIFLANHNSKTHYAKLKITCCGKTKKGRFAQEFGPKLWWGRVLLCGEQPRNVFGFKFIRRDDCVLVDKKLVVKAEVSVVRKGKMAITSGKGMKKKETEGASKLMGSIYTSMLYSDFKFVSNGKEFECHKIFIASQSQTLQNVLESPWVTDDKMVMDEYKPEVVEGLLSHFYRRPLEQDVFEANVVEYLNIAEKYDLPDLKVKAEIFMISNMKKETLIEYIVAADLFNAAKAKESALNFLSSNKNLWEENIQEWKENLKGKEELLTEIMTASFS